MSNTPDSANAATAALPLAPGSGVRLQLRDSMPRMYVAEVRGVCFVTYTTDFFRAASFPTDKAPADEWAHCIGLIASANLDAIPHDSPNTQGLVTPGTGLSVENAPASRRHQ